MSRPLLSAFESFTSLMSRFRAPSSRCQSARLSIGDLSVASPRRPVRRFDDGRQRFFCRLTKRPYQECRLRERSSGPSIGFDGQPVAVRKVPAIFHFFAFWLPKICGTTVNIRNTC